VNPANGQAHVSDLSLGKLQKGSLPPLKKQASGAAVQPRGGIVQTNAAPQTAQQVVTGTRPSRRTQLPLTGYDAWILIVVGGTLVAAGAGWLALSTRRARHLTVREVT